MLNFIAQTTIVVGGSSVVPEFAESYCFDVESNDRIQQRIPKPKYPEDDYALFHTEVIVRHGARTALSESTCWLDRTSRRDSLYLPYITDQDSSWYLDAYDAELESIPDGRLLHSGAKQEIVNGALFRDLYLSQIDGIEEVYLRHTDVDRTKFSAANVAKGLFGTLSDGTSKSATIRLHTAKRSADSLLTDRCPYVKTLRKEARKSAEYQKLIQKHENLANEVEDIARQNGMPTAGWNYNTLDCALVQYCSGLTEDDLFPADLIERMYLFMTEEDIYEYFYNDSKLSKHAMGLYIHQLIQRSLHTIPSDDLKNELCNEYSAFCPKDNNHNKLKNEKLYISVAHDSTLGYLLGSFGKRDLWDEAMRPSDDAEIIPRMIPYASYLSVEFYHDKNHAIFTRFIFNGKNVTKFVTGCSSDLCSLKHLLSELAGWVPALIDSATDGCHLNSEDQRKHRRNHEWLVVHN